MCRGVKTDSMKSFAEVMRDTLTDYINQGADRTPSDRAASSLQYLSGLVEEMARIMYDRWGPQKVVQIAYLAFPDKADRTNYLTDFAQHLDDDEKKQLGNAYRRERDSRKKHTSDFSRTS